MNTKLLDQAIKTLESVRGALGSFAKADVDLTLGMLRQEKETAQPEQEPCRHRIVDIRNEAIKSGYMCMDCGALFGAYATPPQRTWVGLDNDDLVWIYSNSDTMGQAIENTEAKLKEKNA